MWQLIGSTEGETITRLTVLYINYEFTQQLWLTEEHGKSLSEPMNKYLELI